MFRSTGLMLVALLAVSLAQTPRASAVALLVPEQFPTIQSAIDAASEGDDVIVGPGTYIETVTIGPGVTVRSSDGPQTTIIDGSQSGTVVHMTGGTIEGFSITNGGGPTAIFGGGVQILALAEPGPEVKDNWIFGNTLTDPVYSLGAGVYVLGPALISGNHIFDNSMVAGEGAAITANAALSGPSAIIDSNVIYDNHITGSPPPGVPYLGAVSSNGETTIRNNVIACNTGWIGAAVATLGVLEHNTIVSNISQSGAAIVYVEEGLDLEAVVRNNAITNNIGTGLLCRAAAGGAFIVGCNDLFENSIEEVAGDCAGAIGQDGNISTDPLYTLPGCPPESDGYCPSPGSPLLPQNSPPECGGIGALVGCATTSVGDGLETPPVVTALASRPNPFSVETSIIITLPSTTPIKATIVDVMGRRVRELGGGPLSAGTHALDWDGRSDSGTRVPAGAYVVRIVTPDGELTRKLVLMR